MRLLLICLLIAPSLARAQEPPAAAKEHFEAGDKAYKLGDFPRALDEFKQSYALFPTPLLLFDIAQSYRLLGEHEKALFTYRQYLTEAPTGRYRAIAEQKASEMEQVLEQKRREREAALQPSPAPGTQLSDAPRPTPAYKRWYVWTPIV